MVNIDVELDGLADLQQEFEELEQRGTTDAVFEVVSQAEYSRPLEFGRGPIRATGDEPLTFKVDGEWVSKWEVSGHPPYPFFRPAIRDFQANPETFVARHQEPLETAETTADALELISLSLEVQMTLNANANASGRSSGTHPDHPVFQSGNLARGIVSRRIK